MARHLDTKNAILPSFQPIFGSSSGILGLNDADIDIAHKMTKKFGIKFMDLRKIHYNVMCRVMQENGADILVGRAKSVAARHYVMYELDKIVEQYSSAWKKHALHS